MSGSEFWIENRYPVISGLAGIISSRWIERNCLCHWRAWQQCTIHWVLLVSLCSVAGALHNKLWNIKELVGDQGKKLLDLSCSTDKTFYILYVENCTHYFSCLKFSWYKWMLLLLTDFQGHLLCEEPPGFSFFASEMEIASLPWNREIGVLGVQRPMVILRPCLQGYEPDSVPNFFSC